MTPERLAAETGNPWHDFWLNLKEGYDWFGQKGTPPNVTIRDGRYAFD